MQTIVHGIRAGISNCYLLMQDGVVLVDCGVKGSSRSILRALRRYCQSPDDLNLIVLTHGHDDHIGATGEIVKETGANVALHGADAAWLKRGESVPAPPATRWARLLSPLMDFEPFFARMMAPPITVDLVLGDDDFSLLPYGIQGKVIHTPGHTAGSVSILLEDGSAFVGDLFMNGFPSLRFRPGFPIVAQDKGTLVESWQKLLERGAKQIYPGHGAPFPVEKMKDSMRE